MYNRKYCENCDTIVNYSIKEKVEKNHLNDLLSILVGINICIQYINVEICLLL